MLVTSALNTDYCVVSYDYETQDGDFIEKLNGNIVADGCYIACSHLTVTKLSSMECTLVTNIAISSHADALEQDILRAIENILSKKLSE